LLVIVLTVVDVVYGRSGYMLLAHISDNKTSDYGIVCLVEQHT
jgi:hypothetical protein